jgi:hypothetical protein
MVNAAKLQHAHRRQQLCGYRAGGSMADSDQLIIPQAATEDPASFEVLRVWVANRAQHVSLRAGVWDDPAAWGIMLVDLARHVANAYQQDAGLDPRKVLERIKAGLDAEWDSPTDEPSGQIVH